MGRHKIKNPVWKGHFPGKSGGKLGAFLREESPSIVASGPDEGLTLPEYLTKYGKEILGTKGAAFDYFPLLIKLIDARDNLSIQVHPDDSFALREGRGIWKNGNVVCGGLHARRLLVLRSSAGD